MSAVLETPITMIEEQQPASHPLVAPQSEPVAGPLAMAMQAIRAGMSIADMRDMLSLQKEWEANEARKAFVDAMAAFKKNPPTILKDKRVEFTTAKGTTSYDHATIGNVCDQIIKAAAEYGFSHRWIPSRGAQGELVITCEVTHRLGHIQLTPLEGPRDDSGTKNVLQANQSTRTYLQRHSLLLAFGFATNDQPDDDGQGSSGVDRAAARAEMLAKWIKAANEATTSDELTRIWGQGVAEFNMDKNTPGYNEFKEVVVAKGKKLKEAGQ